MKANDFLFNDAPDDGTVTLAFRNYANAAYTAATVEEVPQTQADDHGLLFTARDALRRACERAKTETLADPLNQPKMFEHALLIESELVSVFHAAPGLCRMFSPHVRALLADIASHVRSFYGFQGGLETRN